MNKLNNNGQVLVLFVIVLPVVILLLLTSIELGGLYLEKTKTKNIIKEILTSELKNQEPNDNINALIEKNIEDITEKTIFTSEDEIKIKITQKKQLFGRNIELKYNYTGKMQEQTITIEEG